MATTFPKYKVTRISDGSEPEWPYFVLGGRDLAAPAALREYIRFGREMGYDPAYLAMVEGVADQFAVCRDIQGPSDTGDHPKKT